MVSFNSFAGITTCILLVQSLVTAAPIDKKPTLARRSVNALTGKFLHITDIHIDPNYVEGAKVKNYCHVSKRSEKADKYGTLGSDCDSPVALVDATFEYLKKNVKDIDFIIYTGDTVRHDRDDDLPRTNAEVLQGHKAVLKYFTSTYDINTVPVLPTIGNNDPYDHNDVEKKDKLFKTLANVWEPLALNLTSEFTNGGYFVQDVIKDKLSIVNLNTMYLYEENDAISDCSSSSSPAAAQMDWLEDTLKFYSGKDGHKLYLMGHVPPMDEDGNRLYKSSCYTQYFDIIGKYADVISGQFSGHTNKDTLNGVFKQGSHFSFFGPEDGNANSKSTADKSVVGLFNAPSILPKHNPGFRVYTYETQGGDYPVGTILDWNQYYLDLEKANEEDKVEYQLEYTASSFYKVKHFDGAGVGAAIYNIAKNSDALDRYGDFMKVKL